MDQFLTNNLMKKIIVLAQIPELMNHAGKQMRLQFLDISSGHEFSLAGDKVLEVYYVQYLNLSEAPLFDVVPVYLEVIIYFDESHLNQVGAIYFRNILSYPIISLLSSKSIWTKRF